MEYKKWIHLCVSLTLVVGPVQTWAVEDFDAEVEESMAESDATSAQAQVARERASKEKAETAALRKESQRLRANAEAKHKLAQDELIQADKQLKELRGEQAKLKKEKLQNDKLIAADELKVKTALALLEKTKSENETLVKMRAEQVQKIAALDGQIRETAANTERIQSQLEIAKREFDKSQADLKGAQERLVKAQTEQAKKKAQSIAQVEHFKSVYRSNKEKADLIDAEIREKRRSVSKMEEEVKLAENEVRAGEGRMKDAEERLAELRERTQGKEAELQKRQQAALKTMESREAKEAVLKMRQAQMSQTLNATRSVAGSENMQINLKPSLAGRMTLARDCQVFEKPNGKSKVLGTKKAGSSLSGQAKAKWVAFQTKNQKTVFVNKGCF